MRKKIVKLSKKQHKYNLKIGAQRFAGVQVRESSSSVLQKPTREISIPKIISVRQLAQALHVSIPRLITVLLNNGVPVNINQSVDFETAAIVADELGVKLNLSSQEFSNNEQGQKSVDLRPRPPIVTVMGHVDHGKTSLLDAIRETNIAATESGGITQDIGAYQVDSITFLDTPGHEAFSTLRAHGAAITDIVVLVVAANEGVKPQTKEALLHAQAANVPIIVAINKIDLPSADSDRVKTQLSELGLKPDNWGGHTPFIEVSATKKINIKELLETIKLVAQLHDIKARSDGPASGVVIESKIKVGLGPIATVLVRQGTLRRGDRVVVGQTWGKIKTMQNWRGQLIDQATPSWPAQITGLKNLPKFGARFEVAQSDEGVKRLLSQGQISKSIPWNAKAIESDVKELPIILKADSSGSLESVHHALDDLRVDGNRFHFVYRGIGDITESDINLAQITQAYIFGFRVKIPAHLRSVIHQQRVLIEIHPLIYELIESAQEKLVKPQNDSTALVINEAIVLKVFRDTPKEILVGVLVKQGVIRQGQRVTILRHDNVVGEGVISSIRQVKTPLAQATVAMEVGVTIEKSNITTQGYSSPQADDIIQCLPKSASH